MRLSVIVPACNERNDLAACLDALTEEASTAETIVVNGPSTDGSSGMARSREDVDVLLDCSSRNLNVARNAGLKEATGTAFAMLAPAHRVQSGWYEAIMESLSGSSDLVTGPVAVEEQRTTPRESPPSDRLRVSGGNLAMTREAVTALDGFDEYLIVGGAEDLAQRIAGQSLHVTWHPSMSVHRRTDSHGRRRRQHRGGYGTEWDGLEATDWGSLYRSTAYRQIKNEGIRPRSLGYVLSAAVRDGVAAANDVIRHQGTPSNWASDGISVLRNIVRGTIDGHRARKRDGTPARNPHGLSRTGNDVVVNRYAHD